VENISITLGQIVNMVNPNEAGGMAYLWDTNGYTWYRYDAFSGRLMTTLTGAMPMDTSGINVPVMFDQNGNILYYIMNGAPFTQNWLAMWNSSLAAPTGTFANWGVGTFPWNAGIQWNVTIPRGGLSAFSTNSVQQISRDVLIGGNYSLFAAMAGSAWDYVYEGYSTKNGRLIWNQTYTNLMQLGGFHAVRITDNVWYILDPGTMKTVAFDLYTGERLWTSQAKTNPWDIYNMGYSGAYGKIYSIGMSGMIYTYDLKTGKTLWTWGPVNSGLETFYGNYSLYGGFVIADNKIIVCDGEHGHGAYEWRGAKMHAVDATSGKTLWNILGWWQQPNIADGYIIAPNGYDGNIYCFGKGQTAITVSAPMTAVTNGSSVLIQGTVTDQSPGAVGTPCVSDQSMEGWMEYLYEQQPMPTNATGVPVLLQAMYPDGSVHDIATVTSDIMGHYEYMWTPPTTGTYKILATFAGSNSYFASSAETGLGVAAAPAPAYITTAAVAPDYTPMFAGIIVAVVIAIVLVIYDVFRKRK
jgi:outer membrane protein assembly factor BamB